MHWQINAVTAAFKKIFYNGTDVDDCRGMQN